MMKDKIKTAIERIKTFEHPEKMYCAFSGGKDSIVIKTLLSMSGVPYDSHYNNTTIDPPELVRFIRKHHSDVEIIKPKEPFLKRLVYKGFPLRQARWCCEEFKEGGGEGRLVVTGIRWAESTQRKNRKMVEQCLRSANKRYLNVIIDWTDADVWNFIRGEGLPYCGLYDEGWKRLGCIMCPMSGKTRVWEAKRYPKYTRAFIKAFERLYAKKKSEGKTTCDRWSSGEDMFYWWLYEKKYEQYKAQPVLFE